MKPRRETSPDGELVLIIEPVEVHIDGQIEDDWLIGFENAAWHTHPEGMMHFKPLCASDEDAVRDFVECILDDRSIIVVTIRGDERDVSVLDPDIDFAQHDPPTREAALKAHIELDTRYRQPDEKIIYRLWSGEILHVLEESSPQLQPRVLELIDLAFAPEDREDARVILACIEHERECERVRIAAIRASEGSLTRLAEAADLARNDYRDLLMGSGFAHDIHAHKTWKPEWPTPGQ